MIEINNELKKIKIERNKKNDGYLIKKNIPSLRSKLRKYSVERKK